VKECSLPPAVFDQVYDKTHNATSLRHPSGRYTIDTCAAEVSNDIEYSEGYPGKILIDIINTMRANIHAEPADSSETGLAIYYVNDGSNHKPLETENTVPESPTTASTNRLSEYTTDRRTRVDGGR
jgi:hypothetical protein